MPLASAIGPGYSGSGLGGYGGFQSSGPGQRERRNWAYAAGAMPGDSGINLLKKLKIKKKIIGNFILQLVKRLRNLKG